MSIYPVPDAVFEQHSAWLATSGAGKTTAVKGAVERMLARGERVVIVDPTGVWWGLRFLADGCRVSPYEVVIFGREHADLPLEEGSGEAIAMALGGSSTSAILSLKGMRVGARTRFVTDFFETLGGTNRGLLNLMIDEVHLFAPQSGGTGLTPAMLHATNNLVSTGRAAGLRIAMITQRSAKVHKDTLTQAAALVALRCSHPLDQRPVRDWLSTTVPDASQRAEIMTSLAGLATGSGWLSAPQLGLLERVDFPMITTFDSSRAGVAEIPLKPLDVGALRAALAASAAPAASTSRKGEKGGAPAADRPASPAEIADAERRGEERGYKAGRKFGFDNAKLQFEDGVRAVLAGLVHPPEGQAPPLRSALTEPKNVTAREKPSRAAAPREKPSPATNADGGELTPALQRVVDAIAWWHAIGHEKVPRNRGAIVAGYSPRASTFKNYLADLAKRGLVVSEPGVVWLTEAARALANVPDMPDAKAAAAALLSPQESRVFDVVCAAWPAAIRRVDVGAALGLSPTASTAKNYISAVAAYGIIEPAGAGMVRAADWLFDKKKRRRR